MHLRVMTEETKATRKTAAMRSIERPIATTVGMGPGAKDNRPLGCTQPGKNTPPPTEISFREVQSFHRQLSRGATRSAVANIIVMKTRITVFTTKTLAPAMARR